MGNDLPRNYCVYNCTGTADALVRCNKVRLERRVLGTRLPVFLSAQDTRIVVGGKILYGGTAVRTTPHVFRNITIVLRGEPLVHAR